MASKVKKGFLYYIAWLLFFVIGLFCVFASILVFNPGKDVFGINFKYVSDSKIVKVQKIDDTDSLIQTQSFNTVNINCDYSNVSLIKSVDYECFTIFVNKKIVGFSSSEQIAYDISATLAKNALNINITEPELSLKLSPTANITIYCPMNSTFANYIFNINTKSGNVSVGSEEGYNLSLSSLNVTTTSGAIRINKNTTINSGECSIETNSGDINIFNDIASNLNITTDHSKVFVDKIAGSLNITANELKAKFNKIFGNVKFSSKKGYIYINELGNIEAKTNGNFTAEADSMHIANINIGKMAGNISLPNASSGNVTIGELYGIANINTTSGNVDVKTHNNIAITTTSGSVNLTQLVAERVNIKTTSGKVTANFKALGTETDIVTEKASVVVNLQDGLLAKVNYSAKGKVNVSWLVPTTQEKEGVLYLPNTPEETANIFNITTKNSGNITINNGFNN